MDSTNFYLELTDMMWGDYGFQALFYFSMIVILILEQKRIRKAMGFWYSICSLLAIYNPVMHAVCSYIFSSKNLIAYYCRLFCLLPIVFVISYAAVLLLKHTEGWKKVCCTLLVIFMLALCGHNAYGETWFIKASNVNKVPEDVLQLCLLFQEQDGPIPIIVPTDLTVYMRQVNSAFSMPYGRNKKLDISNQLQSETPDVQAVVEYATASKTKYIVSLYQEEVQAAYINAGCAVLGYTDQYMVLQLK